MAQTANYGLMIYEPNDVTSYLVGWNGTMNMIDSIMANISGVANKAEADSVANAGSVVAINNHLGILDEKTSTNAKNITALESEVSGIGTNVTNLTGRVTVMENNVERINGKFGDWFMGAISPNETQLTIQIPSAAETDVIEIYSDKWGWTPNNVVYQAGANQIVMTFDAVQDNIAVKVWRRSVDDLGKE